MKDFLGHSVKALDALASQTKQKLSAIAQEEERVYRITDEANRKYASFEFWQWH